MVTILAFLLSCHVHEVLLFHVKLHTLLLLLRILFNLDLLELLESLRILWNAVLQLPQTGINILVRVNAFVLPIALLKPNRSVADITTVDISQCCHHVFRCTKGNKSIALGFTSALVTDHLGLLEGTVLSKSIC